MELIGREAASAEVRAVFDAICAARGVRDVNNFWKALAHHPEQLREVWEETSRVMAPGALDALTKELIYLAVSVTNGCGYCIRSHGRGARKAGMTAAQHGELLAVVGLANKNNRLANGLEVPLDE